ncbi:MAG TPA: replicative DNA helicase [Ktedonobacteraceae bacterium]|nr:replicative DNA helicase [Ktedonobacteraceae bacterium]
MEKQLPQNIEAECGVLGSIIIDPEAIVQVADFLQGEDFYRDANRTIYETVVQLYEQRIPADFITICDVLERQNKLNEVGGPGYITALINQVPTSGNVEYYGRIVERNAIMRRLAHAAGEIAGVAYSDAEAEEALDKAEQSIFAISQRHTHNDFSALKDLMVDYMEKLNMLHDRRGTIVGVPTGFTDLDRLTGGLQRSDLIILAARPAVGKTSLALSLAHNSALKHQQSVAVFSLEMSKEQLVQRLLSMDAAIDQQRLRTGWIEDDEWERIVIAMENLSQGNIWIDDTAGISTTEMRSKARRLQAEHGVDLIIVDYLQLMQSTMNGKRNENRVQEVSEISRNLKGLARELNVPVLALAQLSRTVESRQSKVPQLSDLRESGCLTGESLVYLPDEGIYKRIDSLVGQHSFNVLAVNVDTWKLEKSTVTNAFSTGYKPVYKLTTRKGNSIRATANHKFLSFKGWLRLDEVNVGMHIALPRTLPGPLMLSQSALDPTTVGTAFMPSGDSSPCTVGTRFIASGDSSPATTVTVCQHSYDPFRGRDQLQRVRDLSFPSPVRNDEKERNMINPDALKLVPTPIARLEEWVQLTFEGMQSDVYWDEVVDIQPDGEEEVYDLTVEGLHNFVANNIIVHNSIEQDADIVMFIYRDDVYNPDSERKNIADIIVAKHRNGPVGEVSLYFQASQTRFRDLEVSPPVEE